MKVYIVMGDRMGDELPTMDKVFASREKAEVYIKNKEETSTYWWVGAIIEQEIEE
jgi:hypothetical protein